MTEERVEEIRRAVQVAYGARHTNVLLQTEGVVYLLAKLDEAQKEKRAEFEKLRAENARLKARVAELEKKLSAAEDLADARSVECWP